MGKKIGIREVERERVGAGFDSIAVGGGDDDNLGQVILGFSTPGVLWRASSLAIIDHQAASHATSTVYRHRLKIFFVVCAHRLHSHSKACP